jgi:hypothetical protein
MMVSLSQGTQMSGDSREDEETYTLPNADEVSRNVLIFMVNLGQVNALVYNSRRS